MIATHIVAGQNLTGQLSGHSRQKRNIGESTGVQWRMMRREDREEMRCDKRRGYERRGEAEENR